MATQTKLNGDAVLGNFAFLPRPSQDYRAENAAYWRR